MGPSNALVIVIVNYFSHEQTCELITQIHSFCKGLDYKIICADNSCDETESSGLKSKQSELPFVLKVNDQNLGYGKAINQALSDTTFDRLLVLNPDIELEEDTINSLLEHSLEYQQQGIWGGLTKNSQGELDYRHAWRDPSILRSLSWAFGFNRIFTADPFVENYRCCDQVVNYPVDAISGCCLLISSDAWLQLSGFDEQFFLYSEEIDLCYRARKAGYQPTVVSASRLYHAQVENVQRSKTFVMMYYSKALFAGLHFSAVKSTAYRLILSTGALLRALLFSVIARHKQGKLWFHIAKILLLKRRAYY